MDSCESWLVGNTMAPLVSAWAGWLAYLYDLLARNAGLEEFQLYSIRVYRYSLPLHRHVVSFFILFI